MANSLHVLHVEDANDFRAVVARHLKSIPDYQFEIDCVDGERAAIEQFQQGHFDLAIIDYELKEGNGLSCVERLRRIDPLVPIISISGRASEEVAGELLRVGVDDYFDKSRMRRADFSRSVVSALERGQHWRKCQSDGSFERKSLERQLSTLSQELAQFTQKKLTPAIAAIVKTARAAKCGPETVHQLCLKAMREVPESILVPCVTAEIDRQFTAS